MFIAVQTSKQYPGHGAEKNYHLPPTRIYPECSDCSQLLYCLSFISKLVVCKLMYVSCYQLQKQNSSVGWVQQRLLVRFQLYSQHHSYLIQIIVLEEFKISPFLCRKFKNFFLCAYCWKRHKNRKEQWFNTQHVMIHLWQVSDSGPVLENHICSLPREGRKGSNFAHLCAFSYTLWKVCSDFIWVFKYCVCRMQKHMVGCCQKQWQLSMTGKFWGKLCRITSSLSTG